MNNEREWVVVLMNHLISFNKLTGDDLFDLIKQGIDIKRNPEHNERAGHRKGLLLLFQKTSTRTNLSFQSGIQQLGGYVVALDWNSSNFSISPIRYEARYISRNCDLIMARLKKHADLQELAKYATVPVINGCCDKYHPCQALADFMTIYEVAGTFDNVTITYIGIHNNVANSLVEGCIRLGVKLILVTPVINEASWDAGLMEEGRRSGMIERTDDIRYAVAKSDFVYTDTWIDMEFITDPAYEHEKKRRMDIMMPYQINRALLHDHAPYLMHDMPIHPGFEIEEELIESPRSVIYQQAENRMHVQKALMLRLL